MNKSMEYIFQLQDLISDLLYEFDCQIPDDYKKELMKQYNDLNGKIFIPSKQFPESLIIDAINEIKRVQFRMRELLSGK